MKNTNFSNACREISQSLLQITEPTKNHAKIEIKRICTKYSLDKIPKNYEILMQTLGIGVDIIENSRIKKSIIDKNFINRVFSLEEITESKKKKNKVSFFSKRFAAKEAFSKALGSGFRNGLNFNDISVFNGKYGKPSIRINNKLKALIKKKFKTTKINTLLSISDEKKYSIAYVIIEKK